MGCSTSKPTTNTWGKRVPYILNKQDYGLAVSRLVSMGFKRCLLIIDPQNDFCNPTGSLYVKGAEEDMKRLCKFVEANSNKFLDVIVTLDAHNKTHIANASQWMIVENGVERELPKDHPPHLLDIGEVISGPNDPKLLDTSGKVMYKMRDPNYIGIYWLEAYMKALEGMGKQFFIWPDHCIGGSYGCGIYDILDKALMNAVTKSGGKLGYNLVYKGMEDSVEQYSAIQLDVPPKKKADNSSNEISDLYIKYIESRHNGGKMDIQPVVNIGLVSMLNSYDEIYIAGEAATHCVSTTIKDMISNGISKEKIFIIEDCMSDITGCSRVMPSE